MIGQYGYYGQLWAKVIAEDGENLCLRIPYFTDIVVKRNMFRPLNDADQKRYVEYTLTMAYNAPNGITRFGGEKIMI